MATNGKAANHNGFGHRPTMVRWLFAGIVIVAGLALIATYTLTNPVSSEDYAYNGLPFPVRESAPDFALTDQHGRPFHLSDQQGKITLLYFGFTHCPDECPATMSIWKQVAKRLDMDAEQVTFAMISVDPERDTPEVLKQYLANFNPNFLGLSGSLEAIEDIALDYTAYFKRLRLSEEEAMSAHTLGDSHDDGHDHEHEEAYLVAHTTLTYVIDESGQLILAFPLETPPQQIVSDLEHLLSH